MQVLLLGPTTVVVGDVATRLRSARQSSLLAALALRKGQPVPGSRLVDAVWGEDPPATARNALQVHASSLRRVFGASVLEAVGDGYRLSVTAEVDVLRFAELVRRGLDAQAHLRHSEAARILRSALALWRGELLDGQAPPAGFFDGERDRLRRLRLTAVLARVDADLALGRHRMLTEELAALSHEHPLDEEVAGRRMSALYRSGHQAEALQVYDAVGRRLRTELGVSPGAALRKLLQQILRQDPALDRDPGPAAAPWRVPLDRMRGSLVGRDAILAGLETRLAAGRVHTLVGPSGVGKTRLATELAARCQARFPGGAAFVSATGLLSVEPLVDRLVDAVGGESAVPGEDRDERRRLVTAAEALLILDDLDPTPSMRAELDALVAESRSTFLSTSARPPGLLGEQIVTVPPLEPDASTELLLRRARSAGADPVADESTRRQAARCAGLLDGFPLAIELVAPLAVAGLAELAELLERRRAGAGSDPLTVSFASSLDRLDDHETDLLDLLASAGGAVDAELVADAGLEGSLAALVRDGLVGRSMGPHGSGLFTVVGAVAAYLVSTRGPERESAAGRRLVAALARTAGSPARYLPMMLPSAAKARRLVALEPVLVRAATLAQGLGLPREAADIALLLPELHFARYGVAPPAGRFRWLTEEPTLDPGRRVDLLVSLAVEYQHEDRRQLAEDALADANALALGLDDPGRLAQVLAHRAMSRLLSAVEADDSVEIQRRAVRAAEASGSSDVLAGTLVLLYPTSRTPADLADTLPRAAALARATGHRGLLAMALANLSMAELDRGQVEEARIHAREAGALAQELHNRAVSALMRGVLQTAEALAGQDVGLAPVAEHLDLAWRRRDLRTSTEAILRLAAGVRRQRGDEAAARCLGVYEALLVSEGTVANQTERAFAARWLDGVVAILPGVSVDEAVSALVGELAGAPVPR